MNTVNNCSFRAIIFRSITVGNYAIFQIDYKYAVLVKNPRKYLVFMIFFMK